MLVMSRVWFFLCVCLFQYAVVTTHGTLETRVYQPMSPERLQQCHDERADWIARHFPHVPYNAADEIVPGLWVGSVCAARNASFLSEHGIGLALSVANEWNFDGQYGSTRYVYVPGLQDSVDEDGNQVLSTFLNAARQIREFKWGNDMTDASVYATYLFMRDFEREHRWSPRQFQMTFARPAAVLVYCNMGVSRSVAVAMAYLRLHSEFDPALVRKKRPVARPNALYMEVLETLSLFEDVLTHPD